MQSLNQGIEFKDKKIRYGGLVKAANTIKGLKEGFESGDTRAEKIQQFNDQIIEFHGSIKGDGDRTREMVLEAAMDMLKKDNDMYGFEYQKKTKKVIFRTYKSGVLPKNDSLIPSLKYQKGWTTYLKPNNGMAETKLQDIGGDNAIQRVQSKERREMQTLENEYNLLLSQYKSTYKRYLDEVVSKTAASSTTMSNQIRQAPNGRHFYISGMGVAREFDPNSWNKRDQSSCPSSSGSMTNEQLNALTRGTNMGQGEACRGGGYVAKSDNGTMAWISTEGTSHIFKDYLNRNSSCPSNYTRVTNKQFDAIPKGSPFGVQDSCEVVQLDTGAGRAVIAMNEKLKNLADKMKDLVVNSNHNANTISQSKKEIIRGMEGTIAELQDKRKQINELRTNIATSQATSKQQIISAEQVQLKYFAWALAGLTLGVMALRQIQQAR